MFSVDHWKYLKSVLKQSPLSHFCWILLPSIYYKSLLQPVKQTERLSRPPSAWTGSKMRPCWCRQTIFKEDASETSKTTGVVDNAVFHCSRAAREVFRRWDWDKNQCFFTLHIMNPVTHHQSMTQRSQNPILNRV